MQNPINKYNLQDAVSAIATCWSIKRRDGITLRFTDCDHDITIKNQTYLASGSLTASNISTNGGTNVDNFEVTGAISSDLISEDDIMQGKYDHAEITISYVNYLNPQLPVLKLKKGWLGEIKFNKQQFTAEIRGITQALHKKFLRSFSPLCRAQFADKYCQVKESDFSFGNLKIDGFINQFSFNSRDFLVLYENSSELLVNMLKFSRIALINDAEKQLFTSEVHSLEGIRIELVREIPQKALKCVKFQIIAGCDKKFATCCDLYNNAKNFRGEPHAPIEINDYL